MFYGLFEETPETESSSLNIRPFQSTTVNSSYMEGYLKLPTAPRQRCGLCGLDNQGATCYLNSLIQTLNFTPEFRELLLKIPQNELEVPKVRVIPIQLQKLFARLLLADKEAIETTELTNSFGWTGVEELQQHDVQELNRILFSAIEKSLEGTSGENIIRRLYCGTITNQIRCLECSFLSERMEDFQDLTIIVSGLKSLENSLFSHYSTQEIMCDKNQYFCSICDKKVDAEKRTKLCTLPQILTFSLMRFSYDFEKRERYKETEHFSFPLELNMEDYSINVSESNKDKYIYELFSVVIHSGSGYGGHYHAYIKDIDGLGNWTAPFETELVVETKVEQQVPENIDKSNILQLLIHVLKMQTDYSLSIPNLCLELVKLVGSSWKTMYKKSHGSIHKFLRKHSDIFFVNDASQMVSLKEYKPIEEISNPTPLNSENTTISPEEIWFDFNDVNIKPIALKDIKKQFSGNESAYMLFYRQKCLQRPSDAKGNPFYGVPEHLVELVERENEQAQLDRKTYEDNQNNINVSLLFGDHHEFNGGVLKPIPDTIKNVVVPIDQRKTLQDLRDQIFLLAPDLCLSPDFKLHFAKELPAGLHLFKEFQKDLNDQSLKDLKILNNDYLFVSYGDQLADVPVGEECVPTIINISFLTENQEHVITKIFPRNITVGEIKIALSTETPLNLPMTLKIEGKDCAKTEMEDEKKLSDYKILDGDNLIAHDSNIDKNAIILKIYNKFSLPKSMNDSSCASTEMIVSKNVRIESLKVDVLLKFNLDVENLPGCRLRKFSSQGFSNRTPLYEEDIIDNVLLKDEKELVFEDGEPPKADEITLYFDINAEKNEAPQYNMNFSKAFTIRECIQQMISTIGLDENKDFSFCKFNMWLDEFEAIKDTKLSLDEAELKNGDVVKLREKSSKPVNNTLTLHLRLYPTPEKLQSVVFKIEQDVIREEQAKAIQHATNEILAGVNEGYVPLGTIEIPDDATLCQLKAQITMLPIISKLPIENYRYLRLRHTEKEIMTSLIRNHSQTLKQLKINTQNVLGVQVLTSAEGLKTNELLLSVAQRIPDTQMYLPACDLVWDGEKNFYLKSLQTCLSEGLGIPVAKLLMAKHNPKKFEWAIISDFVNAKKSNKKKGKINLRQAPFNLKDCDFIGVKHKDYDRDFEDFSCEEDKQGKLLKAMENLEIKETHREEEPTVVENRIRGGSLNSPAKKPPKCPEVGIKIHVDDFT